MKIAVFYFSNIVKQKSEVLHDHLRQQGVELVAWDKLRKADGALIFNIHGPNYPAIAEALYERKKILSLQEGMFATGWTDSVPDMKSECVRANAQQIMSFVWSKLDFDTYRAVNRSPDLMRHYGNPEHDLLFNTPTRNRQSFGFPEDAIVIAHIDQYSHKRGGPDEKQMMKMRDQISRLGSYDDRLWVIRCVHPKQNRSSDIGKKRRNYIEMPFQYPIFDLLRLSSLVITVSSTEGITSAILKKPIISYDISGSPERWPFIRHGVALAANTYDDLMQHIKLALTKKLKLPPKRLDYKDLYHVDGQISKRVVKNMVKYFKGESPDASS